MWRWTIRLARSSSAAPTYITACVAHIRETLISLPHSLRPSHQRSYAELVRKLTKMPSAAPMTCSGSTGSSSQRCSATSINSIATIAQAAKSSTFRHCQ